MKLNTLTAMVGLTLALLAAVGKYWHDATESAIENDRLHREVHQLKAIVVSEFPNYTAAMEWDSK